MRGEGQIIGCGTKNGKISIAVIAKNEEKNMEKVLFDINAVLGRGDLPLYEVFVVDGYSDDDTAGLAERCGVKTVRQDGGKGDAIRKALEVATGEYVLFIDADNSSNPEEIPLLASKIREGRPDMVIVSRVLGSSEELGASSFDNFIRLIGGRISTSIINWRWNAGLTDVQNGFRIIRRDTALALNLEDSGFAIEQEMVMKCLKMGKLITEIPGIERKRLHGRSKICKSHEVWRYAWSLARNI